MRKLPFFFLFFLFSLPAISVAKELPKIAVWDLIPGDIKGAYAQDLTSILASEIMKLKKYEVYSQDNIRTLAGWTEERIKLGCTDTKCLLALGQMDISKLISGRVGKIGNTYSISLNLFDTKNARSENSISEFCRIEDELIVLVQQAVRKLLGAQVETSSLPAVPVDKGASPPTGLPAENYLLNRIFYFEDCFFEKAKFSYLVRFLKGGGLEGAPRREGGSGLDSKEPRNFKLMDARWSLDRNKLNIHYNSIWGMPPRRIYRMEVVLEGGGRDTFSTLSECSADAFPEGSPSTWTGRMVKDSCQMKEFH